MYVELWQHHIPSAILSHCFISPFLKKKKSEAQQETCSLVVSMCHDCNVFQYPLARCTHSIFLSCSRCKSALLSPLYTSPSSPPWSYRSLNPPPSPPNPSLLLLESPLLLNHTKQTQRWKRGQWLELCSRTI